VHVLLFDAGSDQEGIHSLELDGHTVVLLFEDRDYADRYAGLLEAQDFPVPTVELLDRRDMEAFCRDAGYEARFVPANYRPGSEEDLLLLAPPQRNMDVSTWKEQAQAHHDPTEADAAAVDPELEALRGRLEGLL